MSIGTRDRFEEANDSLTEWSYNYPNTSRKRYPGTEDWVLVTTAEEDDLFYEWDEIRVFYSPSARRYFWLSGSGCSCNGWGDGISGSADFEDGDKDAAIKAVDVWSCGWDDSPQSDKIGPADRAKDAIRNFNRTEAVK